MAPDNGGDKQGTCASFDAGMTLAVAINVPWCAATFFGARIVPTLQG